MVHETQSSLLHQRRFAPFFVVQFLGALNDNVYRNALVILIAYQAVQLSALTPGILVNLCAALFILPFFLFSATAGQIADKYEKSRLIRLVKLFEIGVMSVGAVGLMTHSPWLLLLALFLMGLQSSLFGPVKYAYLPQHMGPSEIVGANGLVEMGTFVAILVGTILGGLLVAIPGSGVMWTIIVVLALAGGGYVASRSVPHSPAAVPDLRINWNVLNETCANLRFLRSNRTVFLSILGVSWFWLYGALFLSQFPAYARDVLGGTAHVVTLLLALFSFGIGIGALLCERLSGSKVEIGLVPFGSIGLTVFAVDLWFASPPFPPVTALDVASFLREPAHWRIGADLLLIGIFGGFYIVPLYALIQTRSDARHRSRIIAGNNILNALFMVAAAVLAIVLLRLGCSVADIFLVTALLNAAVAVYIYTLVPEFTMRFLVWLLIHSVYRVRTRGLEHIPDEGPAVIVCNHVSFVDALIIAAACRRPLRFVMDRTIFRLPVLNFIFRVGRAIPIAPAKTDPAALARAYDEIASALDQGDIVAVFPEGRLTDTGELQNFRNGISRILERSPVAVIPMALRGLWGSFFSRKDGAAMSKPWRLRPFARVGLVVGEPLAPRTATPAHLREVVLALRGDER